MKGFKKWWKEEGFHYAYEGMCEDAWTAARRTEWVSVKDKLPQGTWGYGNFHPYLSEEVLIINSCSINIGFYNRENGIWYVDEPAKGNWIDKITHWMPLPINPHKGECYETN